MIRVHQDRREFRSALGFTLIEIMLAIGIFMMVLVVIYSSWSAILRGSRTGLDAAADAQRMRATLQALQESLGAAQMFTGNAPFYSFLAETGNDFAALSFVAQLSSSFPGSGLFGAQSVRRVTFLVEPGTNSPAQLILQQTPLLEPPDPTEKPYTVVLAPNIRQFGLEFWNMDGQEWVPEWVLTNQLPPMVRVSLAFASDADAPGPGEIVTRVIPVTAMAIPRAYQTPTVPVQQGQIPLPPPNVNSPPGQNPPGGPGPGPGQPPGVGNRRTR